MKYRGMKEVYICLGVIFSFLTVYGAVVTFTRWNDGDAGVNALMLVMLCISVIGAVYFLSCLRQPPVRTEFRADGIHVLSKEARELAFIDWKDVKECREVACDPMHVTVKVSYTLLIFQRGAIFGRNPISMCREYRQADVETIEKHWLDELARKLAEGSMSAEEFQNQPYIFLVSDYRLDKKGGCKLTNETIKLWRERRKTCRAAQSGAEDGPE